MERILQHFLGYISLERGLAVNSADAYGSDLHDFILYLQGNGIGNFMQVNRDIILDYLAICKERGMESSTLARRLVAIKVFWRSWE